MGDDSLDTVLPSLFEILFPYGAVAFIALGVAALALIVSRSRAEG